MSSGSFNDVTYKLFTYKSYKNKGKLAIIVAGNQKENSN